MGIDIRFQRLKGTPRSCSLMGVLVQLVIEELFDGYLVNACLCRTCGDSKSAMVAEAFFEC